MTQRNGLPSPSAPPDLGIPAYEAQPPLQTEFYKELVGKLAWAIGSSYGAPYSNSRCAARIYAIDLAREVITEHGYSRMIKI